MSTDSMSNPSSAPAQLKPVADAILNDQTSSSDPSTEIVNGTQALLRIPYVELEKKIRNFKKKLNATQKLDNVIAEHPNTTLDQLVESGTINADQRTQVMKKPVLQAQLALLEDHATQHKKLEAACQQHISTEMRALKTAHENELETLKVNLKAEAAAEAQSTFKQRLLSLSKFLRAAAARRQRDDDDSEETKAFEGALLLVYGGDATAVLAAEKLIDGTEDMVPSTEGIPLNVTYAQINQSSMEESSSLAEEGWVEEVHPSSIEPDAGAEAPLSAKPSVVNANTPPSTDESATVANGATSNDPVGNLSMSSTINTNTVSADAAAELSDAKAPGEDGLGESYEMVPSYTTENGPMKQSWADDAHAAAETAVTARATMESIPRSSMSNGTDGFHEVMHNNRGRGRVGEHRGGFRGRGRGRGRGEFFRGRGRGGGYRGRGRGGDASGKPAPAEREISSELTPAQDCR